MFNYSSPCNMPYIFETYIFKARVLQGIWPARPGRGSFDQFQRNSFLIVFFLQGNTAQGRIWPLGPQTGLLCYSFGIRNLKTSTMMLRQPMGEQLVSDTVLGIMSLF